MSEANTIWIQIQWALSRSCLNTQSMRTMTSNRLLLPERVRLGTEGVPEFRYNLGVRWTMNDWTVSYAYHAIDGFDGPGGASKYDDWDSMDYTSAGALLGTVNCPSVHATSLMKTRPLLLMASTTTLCSGAV